MFALYRTNGNGTACEFVSKVTIAGILGDHIIAQFEAGNPERDGCMFWEISGYDLCSAVMQSGEMAGTVASPKVVIDATYTRADALLLEINHIWGVSYKDWTPILLRMSVLHEGDRPAGKSTAIKHFRINKTAQKEFVHEFLYLQRGFHCGKRTWGRMGYTNAALLYPSALVHLLGQIGFQQRS